MTTGKLGLNSLKTEANNIVANEEAQKFVQGAVRKSEANSDSVKTKKTRTSAKKTSHKIPKKQPKLVVEGQLRNRSQTCQKPIQLYVRNELAQWMEENATAGRGGNQILINYLIKRGIQAIEEEYEELGLIFAHDESSPLE